MSKFFLFKQAPESLSSVRISNTGKGISSMAIPSDNLSFISSAAGSVTFTFNDSNIIEQSLLIEGESIEKTNVTVACKEGEEADLMQSVLGFISRDSNNNILLFDAVNKASNFDQVDFPDTEPIVIKVPSSPVNTFTNVLSSGDEQQKFNNIIAGVNFGSINNLPIVDYNDTRVQTSDGTNPTSDDDDGAFAWGNDGTGGGTYDIANSGSRGVTKITANSTTTRAGSGLATASATIGTPAFLKMPSALRVKDDYTVYMTFGQSLAAVPVYNSRNMGFMYGSNDGSCYGIAQNYPATAGMIGVEPVGKKNVLQIRHEGLTGEPAEAKLKNYAFPVLDASDSANDQLCYVFVIRRDKRSNIFVHNHLGDVVAEFPALKTKRVKASTGGRTDGDLLIETIGAVDIIDSPTQFGGFFGNLARFGVIEKDIGNDQAVIISQQLFARYNPTT